MAQSKHWGSLWIQTPVFNTGGGDFTMVDDATQQNFPLGGIYAQPDSSNRPRLWKYVQWNPTAAATYTQGGQVYYKDETRTIITNKGTEAATYVVSTAAAVWSFAGFILNPTAPNAVGDYLFIQIGGFCDKINMPASTSLGGKLVLSNAIGTSPTDNVLVYIAPGTDFTLIQSTEAYVVVTTAAASGGGLGHGWFRTPMVLF